MKNIPTAILGLVVMTSVGLRADDDMPMISLPISPVSAPAKPNRDAGSTQVERVVAWIRQLAPTCPSDAATAAAQSSLQELQDKSPEKAEAILAREVPAPDIESALLRHVAAKLEGASFDPLREELARRRVQIALSQDKGTAAAPARITGLLANIKSISEVRYRSLLEGRMEDDDLAFYVRRATESGASRSEAAAPAGKSANEIVAEFGRHNQTGSAVQHWRAYAMDGTLKTASGDEQRILLFKMRPDRFRLVVQIAGTTRFVQASNGGVFWQQMAGGPPQTLSRDKVGSRRYLAEFVDPLFAEEGYAFERLADGTEGKESFFRIGVTRADGSKYVARIDLKTYRQIGREEADGSIARYSDFREISGVTFAFREEVTDRQGRKGVLEFSRITSNPGLLGELFEPSPQGEQGYFELERLLARATPPKPNVHP